MPIVPSIFLSFFFLDSFHGHGFSSSQGHGSRLLRSSRPFLHDSRMSSASRSSFSRITNELARPAFFSTRSLARSGGARELRRPRPGGGPELRRPRLVPRQLRHPRVPRRVSATSHTASSGGRAPSSLGPAASSQPRHGSPAAAPLLPGGGRAMGPRWAVLRAAVLRQPRLGRPTTPSRERAVSLSLLSALGQVVFCP